MIETLPDLSEFPQMPSYEAEWAPVYLEPIIKSGERLTIAVVARSGNDVSGCLAISEKALKCLYGEQASGMRRMMTVALEQAIEHARHSFDGEFRSSIQGVKLGRLRQGLGTNMRHILQQACSLSASLSSVHADLLEMEPEEDAITIEHNLSQLRSDIQAKVLDALPYTRSRFNIPLNQHLVEGARGNLFFAGNKVAANVARIKPSRQISRHVDGAKSRLWDLHQLKHKAHDMPQTHFTLLIWTPTSLDKYDAALVADYEEHLDDIQRQSQQDDIEPRVFYGAEEAAAELIRIERSAA